MAVQIEHINLVCSSKLSSALCVCPCNLIKNLDVLFSPAQVRNGSNKKFLTTKVCNLLPKSAMELYAVKYSKGLYKQYVHVTLFLLFVVKVIKRTNVCVPRRYSSNNITIQLGTWNASMVYECIHVNNRR